MSAHKNCQCSLHFIFPESYQETLVFKRGAIRSLSLFRPSFSFMWDNYKWSKVLEVGVGWGVALLKAGMIKQRHCRSVCGNNTPTLQTIRLLAWPFCVVRQMPFLPLQLFFRQCRKNKIFDQYVEVVYSNCVFAERNQQALMKSWGLHWCKRWAYSFGNQQEKIVKHVMNKECHIWP